MSYFFRAIDTLVPFEKKPRKTLRRDVLYNLDEFHTVQRVGNKITARRSEDVPVIIALCKTETGAAYIMDCIYGKKPVDHNILIRIENRSELTPNA